MRRTLAVLCAAALGATALAASAPAAAAPAPRAGAATAAAAVPDQLVVGYVRGATASDRERARTRASAQKQDQVVAARADRNEVELVRLPAGKDRARAIRELQSDPAVAYAEPNWIYTRQAVTDPYFADGRLWGLKSETATVDIISGDQSNPFGSAAVEAWKRGVTGSAQVFVGVIDEGIQWTHNDLSGQVRNPGETGGNGLDDDKNGYVDDVHGWDFVGNDSTVYDGGTKGNADDHGTHVSGTIGAKSNNEGVVGMNHAVSLISGKFLGPRGGTLDNAVKAVNYFTDLKTSRGLDVVATNNSWGGGGYSQSLHDAIIQGAKAGILFVAAAGNSGSDNDATPSYPSGYNTKVGTSTESAATYDAVIAVAAIDSAGNLASFSQYGATSVDLGAPGVGVWSTTAPGTYESYNGTSMATPHVTGAAALFAAANTGADAPTIRSALLSTAVPTASLAGKTATGGRIHVANALSGTVTEPVAQEPAPEPAPSDVTLTLSKKKVRNYTEVTLTFSGFTTTHVNVKANGTDYGDTPNDGHHTQNWKGSGTIDYVLCETDGSPCAKASIVI